jgi:hypothetical protein
MNRILQQRIMAIFIGFIMVGSVVGFAVLYTRPAGTATFELPEVNNRTLTTEERLGVLRSGKTLIEYFHDEACAECAAKERLYQDFVTSEQFRGYVVLSYGVSNESADWILDSVGDQFDLSAVNDTAGLKKLFCSGDFRAFDKPNVCVLEEI